MTSPLLPVYYSYISSNSSLEDVCKAMGVDIDTVRDEAKAGKWELARKQIAGKVAKKLETGIVRGKCASIQAIQTKERRTITRRLKTLDDVLDTLDPLAEKEIDRLTVSKLKAYAETAAIFQRMLYKSYGIDDIAGGTADADGLFRDYPAGTVIQRYSVEKITTGGEKNPPPQAKRGAPPHPHLTPTDIITPKKPEPIETAGESIAEIVEPKQHRRRGKLSGYELTDVFDNINRKVDRDEESTADERREEGRGGSEETGGRDREGMAGLCPAWTQGIDEGAEGDVKEAQADDLDGDSGVVHGAEDSAGHGMGESEVVADPSGSSDRGYSEGPVGYSEGPVL